MTIPLSSKLVPKGSNSFALIEDVFIQGGVRVTATYAALLALDASTLKPGMLGLTQDATGTIYQYRVDSAGVGSWVDFSQYFKGTKGDPGIEGLPGVQGLPGKTGADGASAYQIAVAAGYTGSNTQWLASLRGTDGAPGIQGANGKSAYELAVAQGYVGTVAQWLTSIRGADGASAYQVAVNAGFTGTIADWLASLRGAAGKDGINGTNGTNGENGKGLSFRGDWVSGMYRPNDYVSWTYSDGTTTKTGLFVYTGTDDPYNSMNPPDKDSFGWTKFLDAAVGPAGPAASPFVMAGRWASNTLYKSNVIVYEADPADDTKTLAFLCLQTHTSGSIPPHLDIGNWASLSTPGPIGPAGPKGDKGDPGDPKSVAFEFAYDVQFWLEDSLNDGDLVGRFLVPRAQVLPQGLAGSIMYAKVMPNTMATFSLLLLRAGNTSVLGDVTLSHDGTVSNTIDAQSFVPGDLLSMVCTSADGCAGVIFNLAVYFIAKDVS